MLNSGASPAEIQDRFVDKYLSPERLDALAKRAGGG